MRLNHLNKILFSCCWWWCCYEQYWL